MDVCASPRFATPRRNLFSAAAMMGAESRSKSSSFPPRTNIEIVLPLVG